MTKASSKGGVAKSSGAKSVSPKQKTSIKKLISFIIPVFNEVENVEHIVPAVDEALQSLSQRYEFEFVFTDNHSSDGTFQILRNLASSDNRIKVVRFSRNFGYQKSIRAGYATSQGECVVQLDADLQDPPTLVNTFVEEWEKGAKVVFGIRLSRQEGRTIGTFRKLFYRLINRLSDVELPIDAGDFRLVDRRIVVELCSKTKASPYLRGEIAEMGFNQVGVPYDRKKRTRGTSKFSPMQLINLALDGITAHSTVPLRLASYFGLFVFLLTAVSIAVYTVGRFLSQEWPPGFATLAVLLLLSLSFNALFLGIIGEYLARIYREVSGLRDVIVEETLGLDDKKED
ncbi:MAG: glycosyltransferase family 2 protein [Rhizobiaceae bacterium]